MEKLNAISKAFGPIVRKNSMMCFQLQVQVFFILQNDFVITETIFGHSRTKLTNHDLEIRKDSLSFF